MARIVITATYIEHATQGLFGFPPNPKGPIPLGTFVTVGLWLQLIFGALLLVGLFSRFAAFILSGEMAVAYFTAHAPSGFWPIFNQGEHAVVYCFVFLYFLFAGPGSWCLDAVLFRHQSLPHPTENAGP